MARAALALIALVVLLAYLPLLSAGFFYEDWRWAADLRPWDADWDRLLPDLTYWLQDGDPARIHLLDVGLHLACGLLVYEVARARKYSGAAALVAAAAFLVSPLASQAVGYASARSELLVALFALLAVAFPRPLAWATCAAGLLLTKQAAAPAAGLLLLLTAAASSPLAGLALGVASPAIVLLVAAKWSFSYVGASVVATLGLLGRYAALFVVPYGLTVDHAPVGAAWAVVGAVILAGLSVRAVYARDLLAGLVFVQWLPRVLLSSGDAPQEHHAYLLCALGALAAGGVWHRAEARSREEDPMVRAARGSAVAAGGY